MPDLQTFNILNIVENSGNLSDLEKRCISETLTDTSIDSITRIHARLASLIKWEEVAIWEEKLNRFIKENPPKYIPHKEKRNPVEFLEEVWGQFLDRGVLYQDTLSNYDPKIIPALYGHWQFHGRRPEDRLPPPRQNRTDEVLQRVAAYSPYSVEELKRAVHAQDRRWSRSQATRQSSTPEK